MRLFHLLQVYEFDEVMPAINDMSPGINKSRSRLKIVYGMLPVTKPVDNSKAIRYEVIPGDEPDHSYVGAEDSCFNATWEVRLGKGISCGQGVDLNDAELLVNALVNLCLQAEYPKEFEPAHQKPMWG